MKKLLTLLLAGTMAFSMAACGNNSGNEQQGQVQESQSETSNASEENEAKTGSCEDGLW